MHSEYTPRYEDSSACWPLRVISGDYFNNNVTLKRARHTDFAVNPRTASSSPIASLQRAEKIVNQISQNFENETILGMEFAENVSNKRGIEIGGDGM
jgi:hypothetical protein